MFKCTMHVEPDSDLPSSAALHLIFLSWARAGQALYGWIHFSRLLLGFPYWGCRTLKKDSQRPCLREHTLQGSHTATGEGCGNRLLYALVISTVCPLHFLCQNSTASPKCLAAETPKPSINMITAGPHISALGSVNSQFPIICCFPNTPSQ